jgi:hypothetical protein
MVVVKVKDKEFYLDANLKKNYDYIKKQVLGQKDMALILVDGLPGSGKSTVMSQGAYYLSDGKLTLDDCNFIVEDLGKGLKNSEKGGVPSLDEAFELNKRLTQTKKNMEMLSLLQRVRFKQIFVFICLPMFYDLDKNIILGLANILIHCYRQDFGARGQFAVYNREGIKKLWLYGRQSLTYSERIVRPNFRGRFTKFFAFDEKEYDKKKDYALEQLGKVADDRGNAKYRNQRNKSIIALSEKGLSVKEISEIVDLGMTQIYDILRDHKEAKQNDRR